MLSYIETILCNTLQNGIEPVERPFQKVAEDVGISEEQVIDSVKALIEKGVIKRIGASVNPARLGKISVLVTAHVENVEAVGGMVSDLAGVSHNYLRDHFYNMWFTLQCQSNEGIDEVLVKLEKKCGVRFFKLPAIRIFKLDVRFDAASDGKRLLPADTKIKFDTQSAQINEITPKQLAMIRSLQKGIEITQRPFSDVKSIRELLEAGVIKRISAVVDHRRLGFICNAMLVCAVEQSSIERCGLALAELDNVSHCYERGVFEGWAYNLFGMMHGTDKQSLSATAAKFAYQNNISQYALLETVGELKKRPVEA